MQAEYERRLIHGFVERRGYRIVRATWQDKPDAILAVSHGRTRIRLAVEHTDYYNDALAGTPSKTSQLDELWRAVQRSITHRIARRSKLLRSTHVIVHFRKVPDGPVRRCKNEYTDLARAFAAELVAFALCFPPPAGGFVTYRSRGSTTIPGGFALLAHHLDWIHLYRPSRPIPTFARMNWICANVTTGNVNFREDHIVHIVRAKNEKAQDYDWRNAQQKWLLITASGRTVANVSSPRRPRKSDWRPKELRSVCEHTPFDKIYFWDTVHDWEEEVL